MLIKAGAGQKLVLIKAGAGQKLVLIKSWLIKTGAGNADAGGGAASKAVGMTLDYYDIHK